MTFAQFRDLGKFSLVRVGWKGFPPLEQPEAPAEPSDPRDAQIVELTEQLQGRAGGRQVEGAKVGLAHNGGGTIGTDVAALCVTVVSS